MKEAASNLGDGRVYICLHGHQWSVEYIHEFNENDDSKCPECEAPMAELEKVRRK